MAQIGPVGTFLRARRARVTPLDAGLPIDLGRRRVPGLRREEVASLAGVSVDYYVQLERGRTHGVSRAVWAAVARALRLDDVERAHLEDLLAAETGAPRSVPPSPQRVGPALRALLESLGDLPAAVQGRRLEVLAFNPMFAALYPDFVAGNDRSMARYILLDPSARRLYPEWDDVSRNMVAVLRLYAGSHPDDPELPGLIADLSRGSEVFRQEWTSHSVVEHARGHKRFHNPLVGELTLAYETLEVLGDRDQTLLVFTPAAGSRDEEALRLLAAWREPASRRRSPTTLDA